jgi:phosphomannomutase/phosphoglucomutase
LNNVIFREYDIRGIADRDLQDDVVHNIGLAMGTMFVEKGIKNISLGRDCRKSSKRIFRSLSKAILKTGVSILDLG